LIVKMCECCPRPSERTGRAQHSNAKSFLLFERRTAMRVCLHRDAPQGLCATQHARQQNSIKRRRQRCTDHYNIVRSMCMPNPEANMSPPVPVSAQLWMLLTALPPPPRCPTSAPSAASSSRSSALAAKPSLPSNGLWRVGPERTRPSSHPREPGVGERRRWRFERRKSDRHSDAR
jgi:hypothetical protein